MGWVRYYEQKGERVDSSFQGRAVAQTEQEIKAVLANIDRRHEELRARRG